METRFIVMIISFFLIPIFYVIAIWAFMEHVGDGSWNERIFIGSGIGVFVSLATFLSSVIWAIVKGLRK